jgi:hypothetical protein
MWRAKMQIEGGDWESLAIVALDNELPTSRAVLSRMQDRFSNEAPNALEYLRAEAENENASRDAIQHWSKKAAEASQELGWRGPGKIEAIEDALAYFNTGAAASSTPETIAWHDATSVIIPLTGLHDIEIEYIPSPRDENRAARFKHDYCTDCHKIETVLDWRGYFGTQSAVVDGWSEFRREAGAYVLRLRARAGFLVGSVLRRITRKQPSFENDPTAPGRLIEMSERYPAIVESYPDLSSMASVTTGRAVVFVHGTVSCGIQGLKDMPNLSVPAYRYEHDTFRPVQENAAELAGLIQTRIEAKNLLLVAHSRGGIVARLAMAELSRRGYNGDVELFTFGTPHAGTPLVNIGSKLLNVLFKLGEEIVNGVPVVSVLSKGYSFLMDAPSLPEGIDVMRQNSSALSILNAVGDSKRVSCWGSVFDIEAGPSGYGVEVEGVLMGAMGGIAHDLIVPRDSALAFGAKQRELRCSHSNYFLEPDVFDAIENFGGRAAIAAAAAAAPIGPAVSAGDTHVTVGNIRVRKKPLNLTLRRSTES